MSNIKQDRDELANIVLKVRKELETISWDDLSTAEKNIWGYVTKDKHPSLTKKEFLISLPGDMFDNLQDFLNYAIYQAREEAEDYVIPVTWEAELKKGGIGDYEMDFAVTRYSR